MFFGHSVILFCFIANLYSFYTSADEVVKCPICLEEFDAQEELLYDCNHGIHTECANRLKENFCFICNKAVKPKSAGHQARVPSGQTHSGGATQSTSNPSQTHQTRAGRTHQPSSSGHASNSSTNRGHPPPTHPNEYDLELQFALGASYYDDYDQMGPMTTANDSQIAKDLQKKWQLEEDAELARRLAAEP